MPSIAQMIADSAETEVDTPLSKEHSLRWKLRKCSSVVFAEHGWGLLAVVPEKGQKVDPAAAAKALPAMARMRERMAIASVYAVSADGGVTWESIQLVESIAQQEPAKGRLWVGGLAPQVLITLATTAQSLSQKEGLASSRLISFLGGA